jgi:hypothetical protein
MTKDLAQVTAEIREQYGPQTTLLHFSPWNQRIIKGDAVLDLTRWSVRTMFEASLRLWFAGSSPTITASGHPAPGEELPSLGHVRGLIVVRPDEASDKLPAGFYAVAEWNDEGWEKVKAKKIPAVSMGLRINGVDHTGIRWPYRITHLAVVIQPLFDFGQRRPIDLMASDGANNLSTGVQGITLDATNHGLEGQEQEQDMEEALNRLMTMLEGLSGEMEALGSRCAALEESFAALAPKEEEEPLPAEEGAETEESVAGSEKGEGEKEEAPLDASLLQRLSSLESQLAHSASEAESAKQEAAAAKAALARRDAETLVDAALSSRVLDGGRRADLVELALKDRKSFNLLAEAAPAKLNFKQSQATPSQFVPKAPMDASDMFMSAMDEALAWQEKQLKAGVRVGPTDFNDKVSEIMDTFKGGK